MAKISGGMFKSRMLKPQSKGPEVKILQKMVNQSTKQKLKVDGMFGPKTEAAVKEFQKKNKLKADGLVGPKTMGAISKGGTKGEGESKPSPEQLKKLNTLKTQAAEARKTMRKLEKVLDGCDKTVSLGEKTGSSSGSDTKKVAALVQKSQQDMAQITNMLSSVLKAMHDTQKSIINNLR